MNSIERVRAAIHFEDPDRVPIFKVGLSTDVFPSLMLPTKNWAPGRADNEHGLFPHPIDDFLVRLRVWRWAKPQWAKKNKEYRGTSWLKIQREEVDEWGAIWNRNGKNTSMGHPGRPSLTEWSELDSYLDQYTPDADDRSRYSLFIKLGKIVGRKRYRLCSLGHLGPSQTSSNIRGFTNYLMDHRRNKEKLKELLAHLTQFYIDFMDGWIKYGMDPHGFLLVDDLGEQSGPFFSPKVFQEFYKDVYGTLSNAAHERGCELHMHSCGNISKLLPSLIDWGLDALEFDSPRMSGYNDLKPYRGKMMFWGCVNIQSIYTQGSPEDCEREVWHMMRNLGTKHGGFGAYFYPQTYHIEASKANQRAFLRGLKKYGNYSKIPEFWWSQPTIEEWDDQIVPPLPSK